jgi:molybdopterin biosynthesis enzyme
LYRQLEKIPYEEARNKVIASTKAPRQKALPALKAVWHVSIEDIKATRDLPEVGFPFYDG